MSLFSEQVELAEKAALEWLVNAYHHGNGGFPHSRSMFLPASYAWKKDYAETTGYLIENLVKLNSNTFPGLSEISISAGEWLIRIQSKDGFFYSGTQFKKPSMFNTAQILFGFHELYKLTKDKRFLSAISKAHHWILSCIDDSGKINKGLYVNDFYPQYYSRALWPLFLIDKNYFDFSNASKIEDSLDYLFSDKSNCGFFNQSSFFPGKPSSMHTLAYALEGFYESSRLIDRSDIELYILNILDRICELFHFKNKLPAYYSSEFRGDYSFVCVTGQAQLVSLLLKIYFNKGNETYKKTAELLFQQLLNWQIKSDSVEHNGALPSSIPIWKNYFPFRYTNWTMKFFLDACSLMKKI